MLQLTWNGRRLVAVAGAVALLGALATWLALRARGSEEATTALPACAELAGTELLDGAPGLRGRALRDHAGGVAPGVAVSRPGPSRGRP